MKTARVQSNCSTRVLFETLYYSYSPQKRFFPVEGYYQSVEFDFAYDSLRDKVVLDFGCGLGLFSLYSILIAGANRVTSIDNYEETPAGSFDRLRVLLDKLKLTNKITLIKADGVTHDFLGQKFDIIYCSYVLHHIFPKSNKDDAVGIIKLFRKFRALLNPGGIVIVREVMRHNFTEFLPRRFSPFPVRWETKRDALEWKQFFQRAGFKQVKIRYYVPYPLNFFPFQMILSNKMGAFFLNSRYVLECR